MCVGQLSHFFLFLTLLLWEIWFPETHAFSIGKLYLLIIANSVSDSYVYPTRLLRVLGKLLEFSKWISMQWSLSENGNIYSFKRVRIRIPSNRPRKYIDFLVLHEGNYERYVLFVSLIKSFFLNSSSDIDECFPDRISAEYAHNCHGDSNCSNTKGSFYCTCYAGYSGDGVLCVGNTISCTVWNVHLKCIYFLCFENCPHTDINECDPTGLSADHQNMSHMCHEDANCTNTKGSYNCGCQDGYYGNGRKCEGDDNIKHLRSFWVK